MNALILACTLVGGDATIPFHFAKPGIPLIMVPININGYGPFECILDTGNATYPLLISEGTVKKLGLDSDKFKSMDGYVVGFNKAFQDGHVDSFEIGGIKQGKTKVLVGSSMDQLQKSLGVPIEANLGYPFLKNYVLTLDFKGSVLTLGKNPLGKGSFGFKTFPKAPLILVEASSGGKTFNFVMDTGASATCISQEAAESLKLKKGAKIPLNGDVTGNMALMANLKVGNREQENVNVVIADFVAQLSEEMGTKIDGVLGYNFWSKYQLSIDYLRKRMLFADPK